MTSRKICDMLEAIIVLGLAAWVVFLCSIPLWAAEAPDMDACPCGCGECRRHDENTGSEG